MQQNFKDENVISVRLDPVTLQVLTEIAALSQISVEEAAARAVRYVTNELYYFLVQEVNKNGCAARRVN